MKLRIARFPAVFLIALTSSGFVLAKDSILLGNRNPDAPEGLDQFGQFAGTWKCAPASRQPDGSIQESALRPTWVWNYALNGMAIQDVWIPDAENAPAGSVMGTNLRVYNTETDSWDMVWTTETMGGVQTFKSSMEDGNMVKPHKVRLILRLNFLPARSIVRDKGITVFERPIQIGGLRHPLDLLCNIRVGRTPECIFLPGKEAGVPLPVV